MVPHTTLAHTDPDPLPEEIADHVAGLLAALGETADAVAARLAELGITGHRDEADRCPIANYLTRTVPSLRTVTVLDRVIDLCTVTDADTSLTAPDAVTNFVALFDLGHYPQLDASPLPNPAADPGTTIRKEVHT